MEHVNKHQGNYGDFLGVTDYQTAMNRVMDANNAFESLPAKIRAEFENDPGTFLQFMEDPENEKQAREMGLLPPREAPPEPEPQKKDPQDPVKKDPAQEPPEGS